MEARISVRDLHYEPDHENREKACMDVMVRSEDRVFNFAFSFQLREQTGNVDATLQEGRECLIDLFRAALDDLESAQLQTE
ncbi:hypothetical protein SAMN05216548_11277 [Faunimonas pinastri]|uniref:Uncharacterized protein n=2 Tax=Faunimonas pinastri TaxID=1855383 RepID=A0A1H9LZF0_9HYPH|nr:hypothetical protein SAMN05216548_11277 [Faunimonas pinastri]